MTFNIKKNRSYLAILLIASTTFILFQNATTSNLPNPSLTANEKCNLAFAGSGFPPLGQDGDWTISQVFGLDGNLYIKGHNIANWDGTSTLPLVTTFIQIANGTLTGSWGTQNNSPGRITKIEFVLPNKIVITGIKDRGGTVIGNLFLEGFRNKQAYSIGGSLTESIDIITWDATRKEIDVLFVKSRRNANINQKVEFDCDQPAPGPVLSGSEILPMLLNILED